MYVAKGAALGDSPHALLCKAIVALRSNGAVVKSVVCDGAQSYKLFGVTGNCENTEHLFSLPDQTNGGQSNKNNSVYLNYQSSNSEADTLGDFEELDQTGSELDLPGNEHVTYVTTQKKVSSFEHLMEKDECIYFFVDIAHLQMHMKLHL